MYLVSLAVIDCNTGKRSIPTIHKVSIHRFEPSQCLGGWVQVREFACHGIAQTHPY